MYRRHFVDLLNRLTAQNTCKTVEIYHRIRLEAMCQDGSVLQQGCAAVTRIRVLGEGGMRDVALSDQLPRLDTVNMLLDLAVPESSDYAPISATIRMTDVVKQEKKSWHNWSGLSRDILVSSLGAEAVVETAFHLLNQNGIVTRECLARGGRCGSSEGAVLLSPDIVARAVQAGEFRKHLCKGSAGSLIHDRFDGVGETRWEWSRSPRQLQLLSGSLAFQHQEVEPHRGLPIDDLDCSAGICRGMKNGHTVCTFNSSVLESIKHVSKPVLFFDGRILWYLPFVSVEGDIRWH